jgi:hypothetical protein
MEDWVSSRRHGLKSVPSSSSFNSHSKSKSVAKGKEQKETSEENQTKVRTPQTPFGSFLCFSLVFSLLSFFFVAYKAELEKQRVLAKRKAEPYRHLLQLVYERMSVTRKYYEDLTNYLESLFRFFLFSFPVTALLFPFLFFVCLFVCCVSSDTSDKNPQANSHALVYQDVCFLFFVLLCWLVSSFSSFSLFAGLEKRVVGTAHDDVPFVNGLR